MFGRKKKPQEPKTIIISGGSRRMSEDEIYRNYDVVGYDPETGEYLIRLKQIYSRFKQIGIVEIKGDSTNKGSKIK